MNAGSSAPGLTYSAEKMDFADLLLQIYHGGRVTPPHAEVARLFAQVVMTFEQPADAEAACEHLREYLSTCAQRRLAMNPTPSAQDRRRSFRVIAGGVR